MWCSFRVVCRKRGKNAPFSCIGHSFHMVSCSEISIWGIFSLKMRNFFVPRGWQPCAHVQKHQMLHGEEYECCFFVQTYLYIRRHNREKSPERSSSQPVRSGNSRERQENRLAVMFMAIVAVFFICHTPRFDTLLCSHVYGTNSLSLFRIIMDVCETMWRRRILYCAVWIVPTQYFFFFCVQPLLSIACGASHVSSLASNCELLWVCRLKKIKCMILFKNPGLLESKVVLRRKSNSNF